MRYRGHKQVSIVIDPELHEKGKAEAERRKFKTFSAFVAHLLTTAVRGREKYEARRAGSKSDD